MSAPGSVDVTRKVRFCAAHRYHREDWTPEKNREVFGACNNPYGHGHNYELEVTIRGSVDPLTGCLLYTSPSPRDLSTSRMPSSA